MCGIAGIINLKNKLSVQAKLLHEMTTKIRHRGPDDEGYILFGSVGHKIFYGEDTPSEYCEMAKVEGSICEHIMNAYSEESCIALGHRRLSIIDLSLSGHQPMSYKGRYWIVYNGEIYNYIELREELKHWGYNFRSLSDTEVIMAAYDKWGSACLEKFNGMWAFLIYDTKEKKIFISRDRFGIKPLYYYFGEDSFLFASEIKALLAHDAVQKAPNIDYCKRYLKEGALDHTKETAFQNIYRFKPASFVEMPVAALQRGTFTETLFWRFTPNLSREKYDSRKAKKYAEEYFQLLSDAVKIRLRADVRIGAALSGGLDSSTIVYMVNEHLQCQSSREKQETFSSVYKSDGAQYCDESAFVDTLAEFLDVNSHQIEPRVQEVIDEHRKMVYAMDTPPGGTNMGGWYTFKCVARENIKINLDGQGADEQLAGYLRYIWSYFIHLPVRELYNQFKALKQIPGIARKNFIFCAGINLFFKVVPGNLGRLLVGMLSEKWRKRLLPLNQRLHEDTTGYLMTLIHYGDSQSMAHSVESRLPFMDYRLVEFMASIPAVYKLHNGWTKTIARIAMKDKLPSNITWRKDKMGWPDPMEYWFRGPLKEWLCNEIETSEFLQRLSVNSNIRKRVGSKEPIENLVRLLNLSVWYNVFFCDNAFAGRNNPPLCSSLAIGAINDARNKRR